MTLALLVYGSAKVTAHFIIFVIIQYTCSYNTIFIIIIVISFCFISEKENICDIGRWDRASSRIFAEGLVSKSFLRHHHHHHHHYHRHHHHHRRGDRPLRCIILAIDWTLPFAIALLQKAKTSNIATFL